MIPGMWLLMSNQVRRAMPVVIAATLAVIPAASTITPAASAVTPAVRGAAANEATAAAAQVLPAAPVGHAGRWLTDATGRVLLVTGVNMVNKLSPYAPDATGFDDDDAAFLAANGFDAVRVGVIWKALEPQPGVFDDSYLARIASTVRTLGQHGIVSLLDFHQDMYNEKFQGEGAPDWAIDDNGLPIFPQLGFPANYFLQPALQHAYDNFRANAPGPNGVGLQDWYAGAWRHVAAYFRGNPDLLGYDLYNEPFPGTSILSCLVPGIGCPAVDRTLTAFFTKVTAAVRQADPLAMVFSEPLLTYDIGYPSAVGATGDPHTGFSFHDYCPFPATLNIACPPFNDAVFSNAEAHSNTTGDALLLTEFGATSDAGVLNSVVADAEKNKVGWLMWAYCGCGDPTTSGAPASEGLVGNPELAPTGTNVNQTMLAALAVPHPELVAGTPTSYGYDTSSRTFTLRYSTGKADGTSTFPAGAHTIVAVPAIQYPNGYRVVVSGARVVSAAGILDLASCPGAVGVSVTVEPGSGTQDGCLSTVYMTSVPERGRHAGVQCASHAFLRQRITRGRPRCRHRAE
jgi:endoglycosylceramidase